MADHIDPQTDTEKLESAEAELDAEFKKGEIPKINKENLKTGFVVLMRYMSAYKREMIILTALGIVSAIGNGFIPYIMGAFFNAISTPQAIASTYTILGHVMPLFAAILLIWVIIQSITYIVNWRSNTLSEYISNVIWLDYLSQGFTFLLFLPISFHKKYKIGEIGNKINMAAGSLETIAGRIVIDLAPQVLSIVIALGVAIFMKPLLAGILVIGLAVYICVLAFKIKPLAGYQKEYYDLLSKTVWGDIYDSIGNALAIKQATAEEHEQKRITSQTKSAVPLWMRMTNVWSGLSLYQSLIILGTQTAIFVLSVYYIRAGTLSIGDLIAFNAYAAMIFGPFVTIARNWQTIQNGLVNLQETEKVLQTPTEIYHPKDAEKFEVNGTIRFEHVSFKYEAGKPVLIDISFEAKAGEIVALVGESGVGKSTLIDLVSGYQFPDEGKVEVDGHSIRSVDLTSLRQKIAVVPQEVVLFNDTIETNIRYGIFNASKEDVETAARKAYAYDFIMKFPDTWKQIVGERGIKLSVGQKQRVAIARAILRNPRILILDEPTSALDAGSEHSITESLEELMRGKTTFIIAHRLSTVRKADKILVFKDGRIIESGTHSELIAKDGGEYRRLYELQIGLHG